MKMTFKKTSLLLTAGLLTIAFNNCAQKLNSAGQTGKLMMSSTSDISIHEAASGGQQQVQVLAVNDDASRAMAKSLFDQFAQMKVYTSHSANGPFIENGAVCKGQTSYFKTTGVNPNAIIKGCASPSAAAGCLDISKHRTFLASEWVSGNIVTTITAAESAGYPIGEYSFYMSGSSGNTNIIQKVGTALMKSCGTTAPFVVGPVATAPVAARSCQFRLLNPQAVIGGGVNINPFVCSEQTNGRTGIVRYEAGASSVNFNAVCECK